MREVTTADARGADPKRLDGLPDLAGERQAGDDCNQNAEHHEQTGSQNCSTKGRERFDERLLDEDHPAQRRNNSVRDECAAPRQIGGEYRLGGAGARCLDMRLRREVRLPQDETDVGMGDEMALPIDDVGLAEATDANLRHHVPDEL